MLRPAEIRKRFGLCCGLERLPLYEKLDTAKVDVPNVTAEEAAAPVIRRFPDPTG